MTDDDFYPNRILMQFTIMWIWEPQDEAFHIIHPLYHEKHRMQMATCQSIPWRSDPRHLMTAWYEDGGGLYRQTTCLDSHRVKKGDSKNHQVSESRGSAWR